MVSIIKDSASKDQKDNILRKQVLYDSSVKFHDIVDDTVDERDSVGEGHRTSGMIPTVDLDAGAMAVSCRGHHVYSHGQGIVKEESKLQNITILLSGPAEDDLPKFGKSSFVP